jgi:hypothetical protein
MQAKKGGHKPRKKQQGIGGRASKDGTLGSPLRPSQDGDTSNGGNAAKENRGTQVANAALIILKSASDCKPMPQKNWQINPPKKTFKVGGDPKVERRQWLLERRLSSIARATAPLSRYSRWEFSVWENANNLCWLGYIVFVHHPEGSDLVPPPGCTIVTVSGCYYHLGPDTDLGFVGGGGVLGLGAEQGPSHNADPKL